MKCRNSSIYNSMKNRISIAKEVQKFDSQKYKILLKEKLDIQNTLKDILYSWIGWFNTVKMTAALKLIYRLNMISVRTLADSFVKVT